MSNSSQFKFLVDLFRQSNDASYDEGIISGKLALQPNRSIIEGVRKSYDFREEKAGDRILQTDDELPLEESTYFYELVVPAINANRFYLSIDELRRDPKLLEGKLPDEFYLVQEGFFSGDSKEQPVELSRLKVICQFISLLLQISQYHDSKGGCLVFLGQENPLEMKVDITKQVLDQTSISARQLEELSFYDSADIHSAARIDIFRSTLIDKLQGKQNCFSVLLIDWDGFFKAYQQNLYSYLSNFRFDKIRREIADQRIIASKKVSELVSGITTKLLAIPVSFVGVIALLPEANKDQSIAADSLLIFGLLIASVLVVALIENQKNLLESLNSGKELLASTFDKDVIPDELKNDILQARKNVSERISRVRWYLIGFRILAWLPILTGLSIYTYKYCHKLSGFGIFMVNLVTVIFMLIWWVAQEEHDKTSEVQDNNPA